MLCSRLVMTQGCVCARSPPISMPVSEMSPDAVPTLLPPGVSHVWPLSRSPSLLSVLGRLKGSMAWVEGAEPKYLNFPLSYKRERGIMGLLS
ncbi:hypothetical protein CesoFtcFv8_025320 [Champsocephalus esox]|uniref:Uncharacterized protein n=1 Tax=Champsocephalus esox TaxID=159716 RepID=A0AAN8GEU1_9TELE|nr:hypothetical protein CesoFtcFv8_025320 [Champsocephalus esox]